jgi:hypothetical protein
MSVNLAPALGAAAQLFNNDGVPLTGGLIYTYLAGTTTLTATYTTSAGNIAHSNPIVLDSAGRVPTGEIWITDGISYKFVLKTSDGSLLGTYDNLIGINSFNAALVFNDLANTTNIAKGDALVGFKQARNGTLLPNAIGRTVHDKLTEWVSVKDFGATGDGTTDDWQAIENAVQAVHDAGGGIVYFPAGTYAVKYAISMLSNIHYLGEDRDASILLAHPDSIDNILGWGYPLYPYYPLARAAGGTINRLTKPDFVSYYTEREALINGGFSGYAATNCLVENLTFNGNKNLRQEGNMLLTGTLSGTFLSGEIILSSSGGSAIASGTFTNSGVSLEPKTITGTFNIGDTITGQESGKTMVIAAKGADDAYQINIRLEAVSHTTIRNCVICNSFFEAVSFYNAGNYLILEDSLLYNNNKAGTVYPYGYIVVYIEFDNNYCMVRNNLIIGSLGYGILCKQGGGSNRNTIIENNTLLYVPGDAIRIENNNNEVMYAPRIIGNTVQNWDSSGDPGACAIRLIHNGAGGAIIDASVIGNNVRDYPYGLLTQGIVADSVFTGNTANNNTNGIINGSTGANCAMFGNSCNTTIVDNMVNKILINAGRSDPFKLYRDSASVYMEYEDGGVATWTTGVNHPNGDFWFQTGGSRKMSVNSAGDFNSINSLTAAKGTYRGLLKSIVGTSATTIWTSFNASPNNPVMLLVAGDDGSMGYMDMVITGYNKAPVVLSSTTLYGSPPARTYTRSGNDIQLAMASGSSSTLVQSFEYLWY